MSTIFGIISTKHQINENKFMKMKEAMYDYDYHIYKDDYYIVATTQKVSKDGKNTFCGRIRNIEELKECIGNKEASIFDIFEKYKDVDKFDGHFIYISREQKSVYIYKDALGIEPFYYLFEDDILYFASEIKALLPLKEKWIIDQDGLLQVLSLLPSLDPHTTPYKGIYHLSGGECLHLKDHLSITKWWKIKESLCDKSRETIIKDIRKIVEKTIKEDLEDTSNCMLSGGLDSSIIVAAASKIKPIFTFDIRYTDNDQYFKAYDYQTTQDHPYIALMKERYNITHETIYIEPNNLSEYLLEVLIMRDLPGMVDIDTSLFLFMASIKDKVSIILSGECADELFCGYPWYYKPELINSPYFPWMRHLNLKNDLILEKYNIEDYIKKKKSEFLKDKSLSSKNQLVHLTTEWFMQTLLIRGDVIGRACHVDIRMPFASKPLYEYLWNVSWENMYFNNTEKYILREAFKDLLPNEIYVRKKNPYPKTHSPIYLDCVVQLLKEALNESDSILYKLFKKEKLEELIEKKGENIQYPWFGQLMTGPQLIAFLYTIHKWASLYPIEFEL